MGAGRARYEVDGAGYASSRVDRGSEYLEDLPHDCCTVPVNKKQIEVDGEERWLYAPIDTEPKLLLEIDVFSPCGADPAAALLHQLAEQRDVSDDQLSYRERNHIEKWFQKVSIQINRYQTFWCAIQPAASAGRDGLHTTMIGRIKR